MKREKILLAFEKNETPSQLQKKTDISASLLYDELKTLETIGIIRSEYKGRNRIMNLTIVGRASQFHLRKYCELMK